MRCWICKESLSWTIRAVQTTLEEWLLPNEVQSIQTDNSTCSMEIADLRVWTSMLLLSWRRSLKKAVMPWGKAGAGADLACAGKWKWKWGVEGLDSHMYYFCVGDIWRLNTTIIFGWTSSCASTKYLQVERSAVEGAIASEPIGNWMSHLTAK